MPQLEADTARPTPKVHVIGCGALVRELRAVMPSDLGITVTYLPAPLHNRPDRIVPSIEQILESAPPVDHVVIAYGDCGTGGALDSAIDAWSTRFPSTFRRLAGDHCYEFFTGADEFTSLHGDELGTFFLTDYLARHFDVLVWQGLGLADHPELLPMYFGNYTRLVHLAQTDDPTTSAELDTAARRAAEQLGLRHERRRTGLEPFAEAVAVTLRPTSGVR